MLFNSLNFNILKKAVRIIIMENKFTFKELVIVFLTQNLPSLILAILLFAGGIVLLFLKIPGWSLFLGLPAVQIGLVLLIFTFESINRKRSSQTIENYHLVDCLICGRQTMAPKYIEKRICDNCQVKIAQKLKTALITVYIIVTIPLTLALVNKNQELRRQAAEASPTPTPSLTPTPTSLPAESPNPMREFTTRIPQNSSTSGVPEDFTPEMH